MKLLGATLTGTIEEIKLGDCPSVIDNGQVACLAKPNSSIFYEDGIVYYAEEADVTEGDFVYEDDICIGIAFYSRGWKVQTTDGFSKPFVISEHIKMKKNQMTYEVFKQVNQIEDRVGVLICANQKESSLFKMAMIKGNEIVFVGRNKRACKDEVFLSTGFYSSSDVAYYFGQYINGGVLGLNDKLEFVIRSSIKEIKIKMEEL